MNKFLLTLFLFLAFSGTTKAQEFEYDKNPDDYKQVWLFSTKTEAENFLKTKKKKGWQGEVREVLRMTPSKILYFTDSRDSNFINKVSEDLKKQKIPNKVVKYAGSNYIILGQFFDETILKLRQKKLYKRKVFAHRTVSLPESMQSLYALEIHRKPVAKTLTQKIQEGLKFQRYSYRILNESAYNPNEPGAWAKIKNFFHFASFNKYRNNEWKLSFRLLYDAVFDTEDIYPKKMEEDQQFNFIPEEIYWKYMDNNWYLQLGFLNLKWGNLIDTYVADVISPKDLRDSILPRESSRDLPALALKFNLNFEPHNFEILWLPIPSTDKMARYGSPYHPIAPDAYSPNTISEQNPETPESIMGYGIKWSVIDNNLSSSFFYLRSVNREARFSRTLIPGAIASIQQSHHPITRVGATADYTWNNYEMHLELVYNQDDKVPTTLSSDVDGLVARNNLHLGFQVKPNLFPFMDITLQYVMKSYLDHTEDLMVDENEQFATVDIEKTPYHSRWVPKVTAHFGTQRGDTLIRPRIKWIPLSQLNITLGYDIFEGNKTGPFGQYSEADRYYLETEYKF